MSIGTVYLVGAGPGDPGLITVRGQAVLAKADVVVYDHLVAPALLRRCSPRAKRIYAGKEASRRAMSQDAINQLLVRQALAGKTVVRLKGGDPFLFGRGGEEASVLAQAGVRFEVVPGVTSALAVPAYAGIPLTHRKLSSSVAILTGHEDPTKGGSAIRWEQISRGCETLVFLMGVAKLPSIVARLARHGRASTTPAAVISWGTWPQQRAVVGTLGTIVRRAAREAIEPPAVLVVGDVVKLQRRLRWVDAKPLAGRRVLVTRAPEKAGLLVEQLGVLGADVEQLPAITLAGVKANGRFRQAVRDIPRTDWVFFTSPEGIGWFSRTLQPRRNSIRRLARCHIGAIGPKTAEALEEAGLRVDFVPRRFSQEGMLADLPERLLRGRRGVIFSAQNSRDALVQGLQRRGMRVSKIPIYRTIMPRGMSRRIEQVFRRPFDLVMVTSASCVQHLHEALRRTGRQRLFTHLPFASIGPITSEAVEALGGRVAVEASVSTIEGLLEAMGRWQPRLMR